VTGGGAVGDAGKRAERGDLVRASLIFFGRPDCCRGCDPELWEYYNERCEEGGKKKDMIHALDAFRG
jgi:hypothetical protein